jgi:hypothetical protein
MGEMKITLADNWRSLHKRGTVILGLVFTALTGFGPSIVQAWNFIPADMKAALPAGVARYATMAAFALMVLVRYTSVQKTDPDKAGPTQ